MSLVRSVVIGLVVALASVWAGWWALPLLLGLVVAERWIRGGPAVRDGFAKRLLGAMLLAGALLAVFLVAGWLFDGAAAFFAGMGTIFAFWVVYCVILPTRSARRLTTQR